MNRPNILFIMTDQQRGDCLGIEGHPVLQTPNLDFMAASGVRFRSAYSACPVCVPARRTVITGRKPSNHGALQNAQAPLPWPTLPGVLRDAGYRTHLSGKAHWGPPATELGFDSAEWADSPISGVDNDYQKYVRENGAPWHRASDAHGMYSNGFPGRPWHLDEHLHFTNWCTQKGLEFIDSQIGDQPWFWRLILSIRTSRLRRQRIILISIWRWICPSLMWGIGRGFSMVRCGGCSRSAGGCVSIRRL